MSELPRGVVAVGGGQASATAVRRLRRLGFDGPVTVLSDEPRAPYQRPPLTKEFLRGEAAEDELTLLDQDWCAANEVTLRLGTRAESVAPGIVRCVGGETIRADAVLLATGVRARRLPGIEGERVVYLRTVEDAVRLRDALPAARQLAIIGGGLIGSEVAACARGAGVPVTVLESAPLPMLAQLGPVMARRYARLHRDHGVDLRCGQQVNGVEPVADGLLVRTAEGALEADLVVVAVGAVPNDQLARAAGLALDPVAGGIVVDDACRTSMPGVFAAGDVATRATADGFVRVEHVDNASTQGAQVARSVLATPALDKPAAVAEPPWFWSDQYETDLQFVGRPRPGAELVTRGDVERGEFTAFYTEGGLVHAAFSVNRGEDVPAAKQLIALELPVAGATLADEDIDLFDVLDAVDVG